jgi:two-component system, chemotaxis family, chemotaxis protein CheY
MPGRHPLPDWVFHHESPREDPPPDVPAGPPHVLVVDDESNMRVLFRRVLEKGGFQVTDAASGWIGLEALRRDRSICLVLLDLLMPEMDGFRFRRDQMADPRLAQIPTVIVTGADLSTIVHEELKAADYLLKPVSPGHLLSVAAHYCGVKTAE